MNQSGYNVVNGTYYEDEFAEEVINVLETVRKTHQVVKIFAGNNQTGEDWLEVLHGKITRSIAVPPIVTKSLPKIFTQKGKVEPIDCRIVKIVDECDNILYIHPLYHQPKVTIDFLESPILTGKSQSLTVQVNKNGRNHAMFYSLEQAERFCNEIGVLT